MNRVDRNRVKKAFSGHAGSYDQHALVQKKIIRRQCELLKQADFVPRSVLDIGCGTGTLIGEISKLFPGAELVGIDLAHGMTLAARSNLEGTPVRFINADAERLPLASGSVDLVVSTSTFQWLQELRSAFSEVHRVLSSSGQFFFSFFGDRTLFELRGSYKKACRTVGRANDEGRTHSFADVSEVAKSLEEAGLDRIKLFSDLMVEVHPDVPHLLSALKKIGAGNASPGHARQGPNRHVMLEMMRIYRNEYAVAGGIPATYDVIFGVAEKQREVLQIS